MIAGRGTLPNAVGSRGAVEDDAYTCTLCVGLQSANLPAR